MLISPLIETGVAMIRKLFSVALLVGLMCGAAIMATQADGAKGATPFEVASTIDCVGTISWSVTVGAELGQNIKIDAIENGVVVGLGFQPTPDAGTYTSSVAGFDPTVAHLVRFQRITEGLIQEQVSRFAVDVCGIEPVPVDSTPPVVTAAVDGTLGLLDWYVSDVHVNFTVGDPDSAPSAIDCAPKTLSTDTAGVTQTCTASSVGGEHSVSVTVKRDATPPTITCITGAANFLVGQSPAVVDAAVTDATSGATTPALSADVDTTAPGVGSVTFTSTDRAGNAATVGCEFVVVQPEIPPDVPLATQDVTPPAVHAQLLGTVGGDGWFVSDVAVTWVIVDTDSATRIDAGCLGGAVINDTAESVQSCTASSVGGSTTASIVVKRDATAPTVTCAPSPSFGVAGVGGVVTATVADALSGPTQVAISAAADTTTAGTRTVMLTGTDRAGNTAQASCSYQVVGQQADDDGPDDDGPDGDHQDRRDRRGRG